MSQTSPEQPDTLAGRLRVTPGGEGRFVGRATPFTARVFGGELAAQALDAANQTVAFGRAPHTLQCHYLTAGDPTVGIDYDVAAVRDGRTFSTRTVTAHQRDRIVLLGVVGYQTPEHGVRHQQRMPAVPAPEELPTIGELEAHGAPHAAWTPWGAAQSDLELRVVPADPGDPTGRRQFWLRFRAPSPTRWDLRCVFATYASDFTMLASVRLPHEHDGTRNLGMTTLNHTLYFHRSFDLGDWYLVDHYSPVTHNGRGLSIAHAYTPDGQLVLSAVQEGLARQLAHRDGTG